MREQLSEEFCGRTTMINKTKNKADISKSEKRN
jgi:hypothetical protein